MPHQGAIAAVAKAEAKRQELAERNKRTQALVAKHGLRFVHVRGMVYVGDGKEIPDPKGGVTVAYVRNGNQRIAKVSTANCSPNDTYCKATGRALAAEAFDEGHWIEINCGKAPSAWIIKDTFLATL